MPSSYHHHCRSATAVDPKDRGSDSEAETETEEYEEIEEEVEVEEEVEEEVEAEEEQETGKDLSDAPIDENRNNVSQGMESLGHEEQLRSVSSALEKSVENLPSNTLAVEGSKSNSKLSGTSEKREKEESRANSEDSNFPKIGENLVASDDNGFRECTADKNDSGAIPKKTIHKDDNNAHYDSKAHLCNSGIMSDETTKCCSVFGEEVVAAISTKDVFDREDSGVIYSEEEIKQMGMQSVEETKQKESRLAITQIRLRSLSPGAEFKAQKKQPANICDFFAKGWCIKGNSCRFLHIKDRVDSTNRTPERDVVDTNKKGVLWAGEDLRAGTEVSGQPGFLDAAASSVAYSTSFYTEMIPPLLRGESPRWHHLTEKQKFFSLQREDLSARVSTDSRDSPRSISPLKDVGRENLRQNRCSDDYGKYASSIVRGSSPVCGKSLFPAQRSFSSSSVTSGTNQHTMIPSYATSLEELASERGQYMLNARSSPDLSHSLNLNSSVSLPSSTGLLPSHHISAWTRPSLSFSSSSLNMYPLGSQRLLNSDREYHSPRSASLLQSSSPFSGSETENFSLTNASGDPLCYAGHKAKIISNDWEPSVPFRPSFFTNSQSMSSPGSQYDHSPNSNEQPNLGDRFSKISSSSQGTSILSSHLPANGDPVLTGTLGQDYSSDKCSISSHHKSLENVLHKNSYGKSLFTIEEETVGTFVAEQHNGITLPKEEKLLGSAHGKDITKANKNNIDRELRSDGPRHKKKSKVDLSVANNELDVDLKTDRDMHKEPKALKHFRASLVDFVKELVKPTWHEGVLSKDAHKTIVKKAVDKVISTVQPHQIPCTMESVKQYLSLSQPKIAKLVEGYVEKYGKS